MLLRHTPLFRLLEPNGLDLIVRSTRRTTLLRGQTLFEEGDPARELFVVAAGRIGIVKLAGQSKESIVALMEQGDLFGEMGLFDRQGRSATARALDRTELIKVPYTAVRAVIEQRPQILWSLLELIALRLRNTDDALADAMFLDVSGRTAKRLLELSQGKEEFRLTLTQEELASLVGASRERVNKALSALVKMKLLSAKDHNYKILDRKGLEEMAGEIDPSPKDD
ncbi:Crp-like helix-turn-helix domain-containing protein [Ferrithrix thermotolerans DSM 19514]|uniref:Crp-like helix-turn-helix domain-containing protein n=1 Tax=Ferrithrix thermotolerans DSM 19514 TaxID=1121881 RepID=A0A1M4TIQ5_9ACTN|nr:Crp/Fnr family transcriptional regulator [Ferrithrix thermotolerans]SHE44316.1 Crp-like helix-turn-helix domain-containing protein [Ferrithrix thermotolerans DSM 19514]